MFILALGLRRPCNCMRSIWAILVQQSGQVSGYFSQHAMPSPDAVVVCSVRAVDCC
jgi:hypothetical protein